MQNAMIIIYLVYPAVLISSVQGFVPTEYLNWFVSLEDFKLPSGTITHSAMTEHALLYLVRDIFIDNPNSEDEGSTERIESLTSIDASSLIKAYYGRRQRSVTKNLNRVIEMIVDANQDVDLKSPENDLAEAHFDAEQFQSGQNRLVLLRGNVVSLVKVKNFDLARSEMGRMLHTVQDFYSHSNWVENGNSDIYQVLGRKYERPGRIAPPDLETCLDCKEDGIVILGRIIGFLERAKSAKYFYSCSNNLIDYLKPNRILTSGYYGTSHDKYGVPIDKPRQKCSHGGFLDSTSDFSAKGGINKDSLSGKWSPHNSQHAEAAQLAETATLDILQEIRNDVNDDALFSEFLGISINVVSTSIAYVIDITESMIEELPEIQATIPQLRASLEQYAEINGDINILYILVPFNDPDPGITIKTNDIQEFEDAIAQLTVDVGGDEPDPIIGAIIRAAEASEPGSPIYVFTDAPPSDRYRLNEAETLLSEKNLRIQFIHATADSEAKKRSVQPPYLSTQSYNSRNKRQNIDNTYEQLSGTSGGQVFTLNTDDISELGSLVSFSAVQIGNAIFHREGNLEESMQFQFPVDTLTSEVLISLDAEHSITVSVISPQGIDAIDLSQYSVMSINATDFYLASINITNNTLRGNWTITLATQGYYSIQVTAISDLSISSDIYGADVTNDYGFSRIDGRPLQGIPIIALFDVEPENINVTVNAVNLINEDGILLQPVSNITNLGNNRYAATYFPPSVTFRFQVLGTDENGYNFLRTSEMSTTATAINLIMSETSSDFSTVRPGETQTVAITLINRAFNSTFQVTVNTSIVASSTDFIDYTLDPSTFPHFVPFDSSFDFSIDIIVSESATDGYAATFTVHAESTGDSNVYDYISFGLVVTTSAPPEYMENDFYDGPIPSDSGANLTQIMSYMKQMMIILCMLLITLQ